METRRGLTACGQNGHKDAESLLVVDPRHTGRRQELGTGVNCTEGTLKLGVHGVFRRHVCTLRG